MWTDFDYLFLLKWGYLRGGPVLIWSSSDDMINDKITKILKSLEQIMEIIINKIFYYKKIKKKKSI